MIEISVIAFGLLGIVLGSLLGAHLAGVSLWKGPAISIGGSLGQGLISEFLLSELGSEGKFFLAWALFIVIAGLIAWALKVAPRACAVIVIGGLLGTLLFSLAGGAAMLHLAPSDVPAPDLAAPTDAPAPTNPQ